MNLWALMRIGLVLLAAVASFVVPLGPQAKPPISWAALAAIFGVCPLGILFVFGIQAINPRSAVRGPRSAEV